MTMEPCRICCPDALVVINDSDDTKQNAVVDDLGKALTQLAKGESQFESGEMMRQHLIASHSSDVARAFFYPDITNAVHLWLMSCVEFTPPPSDPTTTSSDSSNNTCTSTSDSSDNDGPLRLETMDEDSQPCCSQSQTPSDIVKEELDDVIDDGEPPEANFDLDSMLSAFLNSDILSEINGQTKDAKLSRKRSASMALDSTLTSGGKRSAAWDQNPEPELNDEMQSSSFNPQNLFDAAEHLAAASGLVDSKAKNKVNCSVCKVDVCNTARQRHVFMVHVKKEDMYKCPKCDYMNSNSVWEAKKHCTAQHGKGAEPLSNEDKYKNIILSWNKRCFPEWKQKRPSWWSGENDDNTMETDDVTELIRSRLNEGSSSMSLKAELTSYEEDYGTPERADDDSIIRDEDRLDQPRLPAPEGLVIDDRTCHLCWEESRYPGRHIAQRHLKKPLYECPVCHTFGSYEGCTVMKHIHKLHPAEIHAQPINNLDSYSDEIRELQNRCFPNRPMKLVRAKESSRPRERHHCKKCSAQVAQSDRQRHVYHKHLQQTRIFECPLCNFASNYDVHRVKWHIKWMHKDEQNLEPISHENEYRNEIDQLNEECFPGWQHRRKPFWWLDGDKAAAAAGEGMKEEGDDSSDPSDMKAASSPLSDAKDDISMDEELDLDASSCHLDSSPSPSRPAPSTDLVKREFVGQPMKRVSEWTCRLCMKEFKPTSNFLRHVAKDHLDTPLFMCPLCDEGGAADAYEVKAHLVRAHDAAHLEPISNLECNPEHVQQRFQECFPNRKMKPGLFDKKKDPSVINDESKVTCQECFQEMKTEDRQIHVYRHHLKEPRLYECPICDFAHHACSSDVRAHIKYTHRDQADVLPRANLLLHSTAIAEWNDRCFPGWINRKLPASVMEDFNRCRLCDDEVRQTSRHIAEAHLKIQLHVCPLCDYGAPESRLVKRHLRNHHNEEDLEPIANVVARRADFSALHDKCFPGRPKRLSNITISDEGRRTKCKKCSSAVSRKRRMVHTLEKHMNRAGYGCSTCAFTHNWDETVVLAHIKSQHQKRDNAKVLCLVSSFESDMRKVGLACFPDWIIEASQFE